MTTVTLNTTTRKVEVFSSARDVQARADLVDRAASVSRFGAKGDGSSDDTAAFADAIATGKPVFIPRAPVAWMIGELDLPERTIIFGETAQIYPVWDQSLAGLSTLRQIAGAAYFIGLRDRCRFENLSFHGTGKTMPPFRNLNGEGFDNRINDLRAFNCGFHGWEIGIGVRTATGVLSYLGGAVVRDCLVGANKIGLTNAVDSRFFGSQFYSNDEHGISFESGSSSNSIIGNRLEWNQHWNLRLNGVEKTMVQGNVLHRGYKGGARLSNTVGLSLVGNAFLGNGRNDSGTAGEDCDISVVGAHTGLVIGLNTHETGRDFGAVGTLTPKRIYYFDAAASFVDSVIMGSHKQGYTVEVANQQPALTSGVVFAPGLETRVKGADLNKHSDYGEHYFSDSATVAATTTHDFSVTRPAVPASTKKPMTLDVIARNNAFASSHRVIFEGVLSREASTITQWATGRTVFGSAIDTAIPGATGTLRLSVSAVAADGSSFTLSVENTSGNAYHVQVVLKP